MTRIFRGAWLGALLALGLWLPARAGEDEAKAVQLIDKLKGVATRDAKQKGNPVVAVSLTARSLKDDDLRALGALKQLQTLDLSFTRTTDAMLKDLAPLAQLQTLDLAGTPVTDAGVKALAAL